MPGSTSRDGEPIRNALNQHLQFIAMNCVKNPNEFGSVQGARQRTQQQSEIERSLTCLSALTVDDTALPAMTTTNSGFTGTAMAVAARVVTVVVHASDAGEFDDRLTRRV